MRARKNGSRMNVTVFGIPKAFEGRTADIQRNAISSWTRLSGARVVLIGDEPGVRECSQSLGTGHIPEVEVNEFGTPLLDSAFDLVRRRSPGRLLVYVNADIIIRPDVFAAIESIPFDRFLASSRRLNVDIDRPLDLGDAADIEALEAAARIGSLDSQWAMDIFVLPADVAVPLPPFPVGRPGWDNWLVSLFRDRKLPVVDMTPTAVVLHQSHGYQHVPGGSGATFEGPEAISSRELGGDPRWLCSLDCATHLLIGGKTRRATDYAHIRSTLLRLPRRYPFLERPVELVTRIVSSWKRRRA